MIELFWFPQDILKFFLTIGIWILGFMTVSDWIREKIEEWKH